MQEIQSQAPGSEAPAESLEAVPEVQSLAEVSNTETAEATVEADVSSEVSTDSEKPVTKPVIEAANNPAVPRMPSFASFPSPGRRLGGRPVRAQANVPASQADPAEMTIEEMDEQAKLDEAIGALNEDLVHYVKQAKDETKWVKDVRKVVRTYQDKTKRVADNIIHLRHQIKALYKKKKQIENLKLQKQLELKLRAANSDLETLEKAMAHVRSKQNEFKKTKGDVLGTIDMLEGQLATLQGRPKPSKKELEQQSAAAEAKEQRKMDFGVGR